MFAGAHVRVGREPAAQSGPDVDRRGGSRRTEAQDVATLELRRRAVRRRRHGRGHEEELEQVTGRRRRKSPGLHVSRRLRGGFAITATNTEGGET